MNVTWPAPRTLVAVGIAVVLLAAASFGGWYWYDMQQRRIGAAYAEVMTRAYAAQTPQATTDTRAQVAHDLEELIARHPSGPSAAEAAYELGNLRYISSQNWPLPHSLMLGFHADYAGGEIVPQPEEI